MNEFEDIENSNESSASAESSETSANSESSDNQEAKSLSDIHDELVTLNSKVDGISDDVAILASAGDGSANSDMDYAGQLDALGQNLALSNILLLLVFVFLLVQTGMSFGSNVVRWFTNDR